MWTVTHPAAAAALEAVGMWLEGQGWWNVRRFAIKRKASRLYTLARQLHAVRNLGGLS